MQDLDFEHVSGFEPICISPHKPINGEDGRRNEDHARNVSTHLDYLGKLTLSLNDTINFDNDSSPRSIPFKSQARQYARLPLLEKSSAAELKILNCKYACQIVEISIGGFGITVPRILSIQPGTLGHLRSPDVNYIVSVTRIEFRSEGTFIGLKQIEEVIENSPFSANKDPSIGSYFVAGISAALIVAMSYYFMQPH